MGRWVGRIVDGSVGSVNGAVGVVGVGRTVAWAAKMHTLSPVLRRFGHGIAPAARCFCFKIQTGGPDPLTGRAGVHSTRDQKHSARCERPHPGGCRRARPTAAPPQPCQPARRLRRCTPSSRGAFESSTPPRLAMFLSTCARAPRPAGARRGTRSRALSYVRAPCDGVNTRQDSQTARRTTVPQCGSVVACHALSYFLYLYGFYSQRTSHGKR